MARPLPGAARLIKHFHDHKIPMALASNSLKANILDKLKYQPGSDFSHYLLSGFLLMIFCEYQEMSWRWNAFQVGQNILL